MPSKGSRSSSLFTCAATTVVGTSAWIQFLVSNDLLEIASPVAVTFADDCRVHPSRKGSVSAGAGWKLGWAVAIASERNGTKSRNIFMKSILGKKDEKIENGDSFRRSRPTFIASLLIRFNRGFLQSVPISDVGTPSMNCHPERSEGSAFCGELQIPPLRLCSGSG